MSQNVIFMSFIYQHFSNCKFLTFCLIDLFRFQKHLAIGPFRIQRWQDFWDKSLGWFLGFQFNCCCVLCALVTLVLLCLQNCNEFIIYYFCATGSSVLQWLLCCSESSATEHHIVMQSKCTGGGMDASVTRLLWCRQTFKII